MEVMDLAMIATLVVSFVLVKLLADWCDRQMDREHRRRQTRPGRPKGLRPPEVQGAARRRQKAARLVRQARLQVGAAHVDTDEESAHFCFRLPCSARRSTRWASSWAALKP